MKLKKRSHLVHKLQSGNMFACHEFKSGLKPNDRYACRWENVTCPACKKQKL